MEVKYPNRKYYHDGWYKDGYKIDIFDYGNYSQVIIPTWVMADIINKQFKKLEIEIDFAESKRNENLAFTKSSFINKLKRFLGIKCRYHSGQKFWYTIKDDSNHYTWFLKRIKYLISHNKH